MSAAPTSVSVVTRTRGRPGALARAAGGLKAQTVPFEWVIVNDGDTPLDPALIDGVGTTRIVIDADEHLGRSKAAATGLEAAGGDYLMLHDDDDVLLPNALETLRDYLDQNPGDVAVTSGYERWREADSDRTLDTRHIPDLPPTLYDMVECNRILTIGTLFRIKAYAEAGGINTQVDVLEDWDLWLRLMMLGDIGIVPQALARQYVRPEDTDGDAANSRRRDHELARVRLLNSWLRADIEAGRTGLGVLAHRPHARFVEETRDRMRRAGALKRKLLPWTRGSGSSDKTTD